MRTNCDRRPVSQVSLYLELPYKILVTQATRHSWNNHSPIPYIFQQCKNSAFCTRVSFLKPVQEIMDTMLELFTVFKLIVSHQFYQQTKEMERVWCDRFQKQLLQNALTVTQCRLQQGKCPHQWQQCIIHQVYHQLPFSENTLCWKSVFSLKMYVFWDVTQCHHCITSHKAWILNNATVIPSYLTLYP
jgi:hypothetical protein